MYNSLDRPLLCSKTEQARSLKNCGQFGIVSMMAATHVSHTVHYCVL